MTISVYTDIGAANAALLDLYNHADQIGDCHVTGGRVRLPMLLPGTALAVQRIDPTPDDILSMGGNFGYKADFLRRLAATAGISTTETTRHDPQTSEFIRDMEVTVSGVDLLMQRRSWTGRYELDISPGGARHAAMQDGEKSQAPKHVEQKATTGAYTRAVTEALAIPRGYRKADKGEKKIGLPIFIPKIQVHMATASPEVAAMMQQAAIATLFGFAQMPAATVPAAPQPIAPADDPVPFEETPPSTPEASAGQPPSQPPAASDVPITKDEESRLAAFGAWNEDALLGIGWTKGSPVTHRHFEAALAKFGPPS